MVWYPHTSCLTHNKPWPQSPKQLLCCFLGCHFLCENTCSRQDLISLSDGYNCSLNVNPQVRKLSSSLNGSRRQLVTTLVEAGISSVAPCNAALSLTSNFRSARITSPGLINSKYPQFSTMCLSETLSPQPLDTELTTPWGVILINYFAVL